LSKQNEEIHLSEQVRSLVISALEDFKAENINIVDVRGQSPLTDAMVIASGTSTRHVKSMAENLVYTAKQAGFLPLGIEGEKTGEWVLVDLNDVVVHLMLPKIRAFYNLEKLWSVSEEHRASATS
jgi:ribosome-associated protein